MVFSETYDTVTFVCFMFSLFFGGYMLLDVFLKKFLKIDMERM
jgi:hypothetical protein